MKSFCVLNKPLNKKMSEAIGAAAAQVMGGKIGFLHDGNKKSASTGLHLAQGVRSVGCVAIDFGCCNESRVAHLAESYSLSAVFFVSGASLVSVYNGCGKPLSFQEEEEISALVSSGEIQRHRGGEIITVNSDLSYLKSLVKAGESLEDISVSIESKNQDIKNTLCSAVTLLGGSISSKPRFFISDSGFSVSACDERGRILKNETLLNICCACRIKDKNEITVPFSAPRSLDELAEKCGVSLKRNFEGGSELWQTDGVFLVMELLCNMSKQGMGLSAMSELVPETSFKRKTLVTANSLSSLADIIECEEIITDDAAAVYARLKHGDVLFTPYRGTQKYCMEISAPNSETAEELAGDILACLTTSGT